MLSNDPCTSTSVSQRSAAYTTVCMDIVDLVPHAALQILDVGCSNAAETAKYLDYVANADLSGFDWDVAFGSRRFDCIIFADVLEHLVDPSQCLEQALKRLQPGGSIVVSLPNIRHISAFWVIFFRGNFPKRSRGIFDSTQLRWGDSGGGIINRILNRIPNALKTWASIREFLTYQVSIRGEKTA